MRQRNGRVEALWMGWKEDVAEVSQRLAQETLWARLVRLYAGAPLGLLAGQRVAEASTRAGRVRGISSCEGSEPCRPSFPGKWRSARNVLYVPREIQLDDTPIWSSHFDLHMFAQLCLTTQY